jgi:hypothetical protein
MKGKSLANLEVESIVGVEDQACASKPKIESKRARRSPIIFCNLLILLTYFFGNDLAGKMHTYGSPLTKIPLTWRWHGSLALLPRFWQARLL